MERYKIIKNTSNKHPIYYVIDTISGQKITEVLSPASANLALKQLKEVEAWGDI